MLDKGPWEVEVDEELERVWVASDDFTHDVWLKVTGDFLDFQERRVYAQDIVNRLNTTKPEDK